MQKLKTILNKLGMAAFGTIILIMLYVIFFTPNATADQEIPYSPETRASVSVLNSIGEQLHGAQTNLAQIQAMYDEAVSEVDSLVQLHCEQTVIVAKLKYNDTPESNQAERDRLHQVAEAKRSICPNLF